MCDDHTSDRKRFFLLSLGGAVVLFRFLQSTAIIKEKNYQAGGAIAGFLLIYAALYSSFYAIEKINADGIRDELEGLQSKTGLRSISGAVMPATHEAKIVLAVKHTDPDSEGRFTMRAACIDPEQEEIRVYVIQENQFISKILTTVPAEGLKFDLGQ